ncbi:hypothetical protein C9374_004891 [Naegleria lovaniensis]|uniref:DNA replication licensing factor MCM3 n=1 Tax=Naegleria lovaniensis TaxID=51637 RepID=A0AA88KIK9_NAELO|nr:uncharacterized protein C9374_004891 [Naegleria lovaniensis]KAG2382924.1 hypothetical protein C9374_004891 [Naegleria lovaniensis]
MNDGETLLRHQRFRQFLSSFQENGENIYHTRLKGLLSKTSSLQQPHTNDYFRLVVDLNHIRDFDPALCYKLQMEPSSCIPTFELALNEEIQRMDSKHFEMNTSSRNFIGLTGNATHHTSPRFLQSCHIGKIVCIEGIITSCSSVCQRLLSSVHYCEATKKFLKVEYSNNIASDNIFINPIPVEDSEGNILDFEFGLSDFVDTQKIVLQDLPEKSPVGQLPRSVECILECDLCDTIKPGDRVKVYGIYKVLSIPGQSNRKQSVAKVALIANNIDKIRGYISPLNDISVKDGVLIHQLSQCPNIFDILSNSVAPSIYGHDIIKKALLLLMLSGVEKEFEDTCTKIRGNINVLLIGDPSTAKSQFLRFVLNTSPLAISANARSSSGVGLTAAIVSDSSTNERTLQAGAMVLADRGIVCIDELDKMTDVERVHMHEVMEQQTFSVFKAGIAVTLNARCSVLAACNPIYGKYDRSISIQRNIQLPDSLLSRFDLVFVLTDDNDSLLDREIATHVLSSHKYFHDSFKQDLLKDELNSTLFSIKKDCADEISYSDAENIIKKSENFDPSLFVPLNILKKYIQYAKSKHFPTLNDKSREMISQKYVQLRNQFMNVNSQRKTYAPITPRTLESLIRLSSALAKLHLRDEIIEQDVEMIFNIFDSSLDYLNCGMKRQQMMTLSQLPSKKKKKKQDSLDNKNSTPPNFDYVSYLRSHLIRKTHSGSIPLHEFKQFILGQTPKMVEEDVLDLALQQFHEQGFCVLSPDMNNVPTIYRFS